MKVFNSLRGGSKNRARGVTLVVGLIIVLVMSILVLVIAQVAITQDRMAKNFQDQSLAFQAAEGAVRAGENAIALNPNRAAIDYRSFTAACTTGLCRPSTTSTPRWQSVDWSTTSANTVAATGITLPAGVAQPRYLIELMTGAPSFEPGVGCSPSIARITSRGAGPNGATNMVQTLYRFRVADCE